MLACIPTRGNAGLEDTVFDRIGARVEGMLLTIAMAPVIR